MEYANLEDRTFRFVGNRLTNIIVENTKPCNGDIHRLMNIYIYFGSKWLLVQFVGLICERVVGQIIPNLNPITREAFEPDSFDS